MGKAIGFHVNGCGYQDFVGHAGVISIIFVLFRKLILYAQRIREKIIPSFAGWTEFLKISQNLQENAYVSASLLINFIKSYFPVNFQKFSRTPFLQSTSGRLFLNRLMSCFPHTAQKMKFSIKDFFSKYAQIGRKLRIWSHLLKKSLMENFIFCAV